MEALSLNQQTTRRSWTSFSCQDVALLEASPTEQQKSPEWHTLSPLQTLSFPKTHRWCSERRSGCLFSISFKLDLELLAFLNILALLFSLADGWISLRTPIFLLLVWVPWGPSTLQTNSYVTKPHGFHVNQWMGLGNSWDAFWSIFSK